MGLRLGFWFGVLVLCASVDASAAGVWLWVRRLLCA
jgi:hypothetical protein